MAAKIKKGDRVVVLTGKDKGRQGAVLRVLPKEERVVVEGIMKVRPEATVKTLTREEDAARRAQASQQPAGGAPAGNGG